MNRPFSLLVKPASADCNLRCEYCFYLDHMDQKAKTRMSDKTLETMISSYMKTSQPQYSVAFQGGEPTIMGLPFFKKVVDFEKKYAPRGAQIANALQTNATLITEEMAQFFHDYQFLLGVSMDGCPEIHDHYRKTMDKKGSHALVERGIAALEKHKVEYNILVLVNDLNSKSPEKVYSYFRERKVNFLQFIPCVEFEEDGITPLSYSVKPKTWGEFLIKIFDLWYEERYQVSIRFFDSILNKLVLGNPTTCDMDKNCCQYFVVEHDGSVYPCDFFVKEGLKLGNINKNSSWNHFLNSPQYRHFGQKKLNHVAECSSCPWYTLCHGDCQKNRLGQKNEGLSYLCEGLKLFYSHAMPKMRSLADEIKIQRGL